MSIYDQYETVIGLEVHIQLGTKSKAFCSDNTTFGASPNTQVSTISLAHPGTLPRVNQTQIEYAVRLGLAMGCEINPRSTFDRKNYFYADLPKGYQITQQNNPICIGGGLEIEANGTTRFIRLHHIHMEEDAGKLIHDIHPTQSLVDLNRAGVPLLEMVTEPDLRSPEEVDAFMTAIRQLVRYLEVSDGNMEEGSMRCDCNVSVRKKGSTKLGERCEIKNMNSMRFARQAIAYETKRQINLLEKGGSIQQQTLTFNPQTGATSPIRTKEDAHDYRYMPDPDLPPVILKSDYIENIKSILPALPNELKTTFTQLGISKEDAVILTEEKETALYFQNLTKATKHHKAAAKLMINKIRPYLSENNLSVNEFTLTNNQVADFLQLIADDKVSNSIAYQRIFPELINNPTETPEQIAQRLQLIQSSDEDFLVELIDNVLQSNPDKVKAYQKGKKGLIGFFMGEIMKASKGKANPKTTTQMLQDKLKV